MLTRRLLKFVSVHIGSNYLCTNLGMGSLSLRMEAIFLVEIIYCQRSERWSYQNQGAGFHTGFLDWGGNLLMHQ